jgi:CheY-like chemotaxis protein
MTPERCVLVVDDSALIRQLVQLVLGAAGWRTVVAESGSEAVALAIAEQPDAILLDVLMPEPDGPQTLTELRRDPRSATIPVIFLTGSADEDHLRLAALGADGVIAKPFEPQLLAAGITDALGWPA